MYVFKSTPALMAMLRTFSRSSLKGTWPNVKVFGWKRKSRPKGHLQSRNY